MKKFLISILLFSLYGCMVNTTPSDTVKEYLDSYIILSDDVIEDLETTISSENISLDNQGIYKDVLKRQYSSLTYEIKDEKIDGDDAVVSVRISVYDLYGSEKNSIVYYNDHQSEFVDETGLFDSELFTKYKLDAMKEYDNKIDYDIDFYLTKYNDNWTLETPNRVVLEKIHGLYNYEED